MQAVMITMVGREDSAAASAAELAKAGVTTKLFVQPSDWPVGPVGNHRNSVRALEWAVENVTGHGFLFVEDDIVIKPERFKRALVAANDLKELMFFYMHDKGARLNNYPAEPWVKELFKVSYDSRGALGGLVVPEGPRLMVGEAPMYGAQCFFLPKGHARFLLAFMRGGISYSSKIRGNNVMAIDTSVNKWKADAGIPTFCYLPHPVQHLQNRVLRQGSRSDVYSLSFDLKSSLEVGDGF
jgi:hypothetical protein